MTSDKFYEGDTYEEWAVKQDKNGLEFKMIEEVHIVFPNWAMEDIKEYTPGFVTSYLKIMQDVLNDNKDSSIEDIKNKIFDYVYMGKQHSLLETEMLGKFSNGMTYEEWVDRQDKDSLEFKAIAFCHLYNTGLNLEEIKKKIFGDYVKTAGKRKIHLEFFGEEPGDPENWNKFLEELVSIIFSDTPPYKSEDRRGHGTPKSFRLGRRQNSLRTEDEFSRDLHELIDYGIDRKKYPTQSDFFRDWLGKSVKIYALLHRDDPVMNKYLEKEIGYESQAEISIICDNIEDFEHTLADGLRTLEMNLDEAVKNNYDRTSLLQIRDAVVRLLARGPGHKGRMRSVYKDKMISLIKKNVNVRRCLIELEKLDLISGDFASKIMETGIVPSIDSGWREMDNVT